MLIPVRIKGCVLCSGTIRTVWINLSCDFKVNGFSWNMAVMACAEKCFTRSEELKNSLVAEFGWDKEIVDIRNRWSTLSEAYDWALTELMPKLNKKITFSLGLRDDWESFPWRLRIICRSNTFFYLWLDNHSTEGKISLNAYLIRKDILKIRLYWDTVCMVMI